jgi:peptidyl-prolyl cis-trans isomerase D
MLEALRSAATTWVAKLLLILLVVSFAVWGISGQIMGGVGRSYVVAAGDTKVTPLEFRLAYDRQIAILSQQSGRPITREQARLFGIEDLVLSQVAAGAVLDEHASELGLGLSEDRLATLTMEDPAFSGPDGRFDRQQFEFALRRIGMRPEDYLRSRAQAAVRQQIVDAVSDGIRAPDTFLRAVALYRGEDRTAEFLVLPKSLVEPIEDPSEEVLKAWFDENKSKYAAPEYRKIAYVKLEPVDIADEQAITDEQVREDYEQNKARFTTPEQRTIEQIVFASKEAAQKALDSIRGGATFDNVVAAEGKKREDTLLGTFTKEQVPDPAVAEAAFALEANQVSGLVEGAFGPLLLRVTEIKPEVVRTLTEVGPEIRRDLALAEASRVLLDVHDSYEDSRAAGETLREAAAKLGLDVVTVEVDRNARRPDGSVINDLPQSQELLQQAFETEVGLENPAIDVGSSGFLFFEVEQVTPARDRTIDEVTEQVRADWKAAQTVERLAARAGESEKQLRDGMTMDALAAELNLEKQTKRGLKREANDPDFGREGVAAVFARPEGGTGVVAAPNGEAQILFKVTEVFEPAGAAAASVPEEGRQVFASGLSEDLLDQLVARLQGEYEVRVDRAAIEQALAF